MPRSPLGVVAAAMLAAVTLLAGCPPPPRPLPEPQTLGQLVERTNRNNRLLPWFKARMSNVTAVVVDDAGWPHRLDMRGLLIYTQPEHFYMECLYAEQTALTMGANPLQQWLCIRPAVGRCWLVDRGAAESADLPIDPSQLTRLLGIDAIETGPADPVRVLRTLDAERASVIEFISRSEDGQARLLRELWIDRDTNRPRQVRLFDALGRPTLASDLADWRKASGSAGWFPFRVTIRWLGEGAGDGSRVAQAARGLGPGGRLQLLFSDVQVAERFSPELAEAIYRFRPLPGVPVIRPGLFRPPPAPIPPPADDQEAEN